jgi:hypothetical protein
MSPPAEPRVELPTAEQDDLGDAVAAVHALLRMTDAERAAAALPEPAPGSPLAEVSAAFGLSAFERSVLLLAVLLELNPGVDTEFAALNGSDARPWPTVGLALAVLPGADWAAMLPTAPLRAYRLVRLGPGDVLTDRAVLVDERVLHALMGSTYLEPAIAARLRPLRAPATLTAGHARVAETLAARWAAGGGPLHLWCDVPDDGLAVAAAAGAGRQVLQLPADAVPAEPEALEELLTLWARESRLQPLALAVGLDDAADPAAARAAARFAARAEGAVVGYGPDPRPGEAVERLRVPRPGYAERLEQWRRALADVGEPAGLPELVARFPLGAVALEATVGSAAAELRASPGADLRRLLWDGARVQAHPLLEDLAQRLPPTAAWADLVLPPPAEGALRALLAQARHQAVVDHAWGFAGDAPGARGSGAAALFAGPSGTGKTMAADVLAGELGLDLFRIDLSAVVSKYIGETEKNLRRVFDAAESAGAVLLFDEADALFGKRTEVRDSHDRHANIEVSYLLQRMESYGGLAVLTTNHRDHLDDAFLRRIPFVVEFPFPEPALRERIWAGVFPAGTPLSGVEPRALSRLSVAGGTIRSIARNAAFLAADAGTPVTMAHLRMAAELEYAKLGRSLTPAEVRGWT